MENKNNKEDNDVFDQMSKFFRFFNPIFWIIVSGVIGISLEAFGVYSPPLFWFIGFSAGLAAGASVLTRSKNNS